MADGYTEKDAALALYDRHGYTIDRLATASRARPQWSTEVAAASARYRRRARQRIDDVMFERTDPYQARHVLAAATWLLSRLDPATYGENKSLRVEADRTGGVTITLSLAEAREAARDDTVEGEVVDAPTLPSERTPERG